MSCKISIIDLLHRCLDLNFTEDDMAKKAKKAKKTAKKAAKKKKK